VGTPRDPETGSPKVGTFFWKGAFNFRKVHYFGGVIFLKKIKVWDSALDTPPGLWETMVGTKAGAVTGDPRVQAAVLAKNRWWLWVHPSSPPPAMSPLTGFSILGDSQHVLRWEKITLTIFRHQIPWGCI